MYKKIEPPLRMTSNEASEQYPDSFIVVQLDSKNPPNNMGTVLYVGDNYHELFSLVTKLDTPYTGVFEGRYHRLSLGGIVVGE